jgi:hypothetical protein
LLAEGGDELEVQAHNNNVLWLHQPGVLDLYVECTDSTMPSPKKTCLSREILGICTPGAKNNLFVGVMECSGELEGSISCAYHEDARLQIPEKLRLEFLFRT